MVFERHGIRTQHKNTNSVFGDLFSIIFDTLFWQQLKRQSRALMMHHFFVHVGELRYLPSHGIFLGGSHLFFSSCDVDESERVFFMFIFFEIFALLNP